MLEKSLTYCETVSHHFNFSFIATGRSSGETRIGKLLLDEFVLCYNYLTTIIKLRAQETYLLPMAIKNEVVVVPTAVLFLLVSLCPVFLLFLCLANLGTTTTFIGIGTQGGTKLLQEQLPQFF